MSLLRSLIKSVNAFMILRPPQERTQRRLIIHAGAHKTASTTLQIALFRNRKRLADQNVHYAVRGSERANHSLVAEWFKGLTKFKLDVSFEDAWRDIDAIADGSPATVILSSEEFSRRLPTPVDFSEVIRRTPSFDRHEIVVVLREQVSFLESFYLQMRQSNAHIGFQDWLKTAVLAGTPKFGLYTDFAQLDDTLLRSFAPDCVSYISYQTIGDHPVGPLGRFLAHIGIPAADDLEVPGRMHASLDPLGFVIAREVLGGEMPSNPQVEAAKVALFERHSDKTRTTLHTRESIATVRARFEGLNLDFSRKVSSRLSGPIQLSQGPTTSLYYDEISQEDREAVKLAILGAD